MSGVPGKTFTTGQFRAYQNECNIDLENGGHKTTLRYKLNYHYFGMANFSYNKKDKSGSHFNICSQIGIGRRKNPPLLLEIQVGIGEGADKPRFLKTSTTYSSISIKLATVPTNITV